MMAKSLRLVELEDHVMYAKSQFDASDFEAAGGIQQQQWWDQYTRACEQLEWHMEALGLIPRSEEKQRRRRAALEKAAVRNSERLNRARSSGDD